MAHQKSFSNQLFSNLLPKIHHGDPNLRLNAFDGDHHPNLAGVFREGQSINATQTVLVHVVFLCVLYDWKHEKGWWRTRKEEGVNRWKIGVFGEVVVVLAGTAAFD